MKNLLRQNKSWLKFRISLKLLFLQGYRSLEDLKERASLTKQQQVGLKHYDDFANKMSREEVERIGATVSMKNISSKISRYTINGVRGWSFGQV